MTQPSLLSAASIIAAADLAHEDVSVPEWPDPVTNEPGVIRIVQLPAFEAMELTNEMTDTKNADDGMFLVLIHCARNADNSHIFTKDDLPHLRGKSMRVVNRLQAVALRLNSMDPISEVALKKG